MSHPARLQAYIQTALWSSTDDNDAPLDDNYDISDIHPDTLASMQSDIDAFFTLLETEGLLEEALEYVGAAAKDFDAEGRIAHDFWLTRNGHGAGFWDGDYGSLGGKLTEFSQTYGSCDLYVGDDGLIYSL